jgi:hypothetical protein
MSILSLFDDTANTVRLRYLSAMYGAVGAFSNALESSDPTLPSVKMQLFRATDAIAKTFRDSVMDFVSSQVDRSVEMALANVGISVVGATRAEIYNYAESAKQDFGARLDLVLAANTQSVLDELKKVALQVQLLQSGLGMSRIGALLKIRAEAVKGLAFTTFDRIGHKWASELYLATTVRATMVDTYVQGFLYALQQANLDLVKIRYADASHANDDLAFSITGKTPGYPAYADIAREVFHPNTTATLERMA